MVSDPGRCPEEIELLLPVKEALVAGRTVTPRRVLRPSPQFRGHQERNWCRAGGCPVGRITRSGCECEFPNLSGFDHKVKWLTRLTAGQRHGLTFLLHWVNSSGGATTVDVLDEPKTPTHRCSASASTMSISSATRCRAATSASA